MDNAIVFVSMTAIPLPIHLLSFKPLVIVSQLADYLLIVAPQKSPIQSKTLDTGKSVNVKILQEVLGKVL